MNFHDNEIDIERAYHSIALEYSKRELSEYESDPQKADKVKSPQDKIDFLFTEYMMAYGYLCNNTEGSVRALLEHNYSGN